MGKVVAISGVGDAPSPGAAMAWTVIIGTVVGIFVGTLMIRPPKTGRS